MTYVCKTPESFEGKKVGSGQCVAFVQQVAKAPHTSFWVEGSKVRGAKDLARGTAIATFVTGKYLNLPTGNHAAIYDSQDASGIWVWDQWLAQGCVKKRLIRFKNGSGSASNDGDRFSVIG